MAPFYGRCGEDIGIATVLYFQFLAQLLSAQWEVTHRDIGLANGGEN